MRCENSSLEKTLGKIEFWLSCKMVRWIFEPHHALHENQHQIRFVLDLFAFGCAMVGFRFSIHTPNHNIKEHKKRTQPRRQTTRRTFWRFAHPRNTLTSVVDSLARHKWALNTIISDTLTQFIFTLIFLRSFLISSLSFCETRERKILAIEVPLKSLGSCVFPRRFRIF